MPENVPSVRDAAAILDGERLTDRPELAPVVRVVDELRRSVEREPVPPVGDELRALLDAGSDAEPDVVIDLRETTSRRRRVIGGGAMALALLLGGTGVAAANGSLPDALQEIVHDAGGVVGLEVPHGEAGEDPQPGHGRDGQGHDPQGPKDPQGAATPADPGEPGGGATPATPPVSTPRPADAGTPQQPADPGKPAESPADTRPEPPGPSANGGGKP